ncbi:hypothetical protein [uncultured Desulfovibrio sp.]|uniref:hypothetical protein n=1 Tax=uncultured Desulfovibrio sp. TaxID=167968 RepID=UPI002803A8D0|nr:hypothetical protein [uncultured Desulfovibrio sp.]
MTERLDHEAAMRETRDEERRNALRDLHAVLGTEAGLRVMERLLRGMKTFGQLSDAADMNWHNMGQWILDDMAAAHPVACVKLMARLRGIGGAETMMTMEDDNG